jgi:serine/threonine-protein kinase
MKAGELIANRYMLLRRVGMGPLTIVYLAEDTALNRPVAVKVLRPEIAAQQAVTYRFQQATQRTAGLSHPNLAAVHAVGSDGGIHYQVTEYLSAGSLRDRIDLDGRIAVDEALELAIAIAAGSAACHSHDIIHGDLKPQNVMLGEHRSVKVAGGGMGRVLTAAHSEREACLPEPAACVSPEEVASQPLTPASDVYALGIMFYEMLTGRSPFGDQAASMTAPMRLRLDIPSLHEQNPRVPPPLARIVHKMLSKDPQNRYASAQQLHHILLSYQRQRADFSRRVGPGEAHTDRSAGARNVGMPTSSATIVDSALRSSSEQEGAEEGMDWPFALLSLLTLLAILGLIVLWTIVYRRYTLPLG